MFQTTTHSQNVKKINAAYNLLNTVSFWNPMKNSFSGSFFDTHLGKRFFHERAGVPNKILLGWPAQSNSTEKGGGGVQQQQLSKEANVWTLDPAPKSLLS